MRGTAGRMGSAPPQGARPRVDQVPTSVPNTVQMGSAQCLGAPPTHTKGKGCAGSIPTRQPALPKAAATTLQHGGFAVSMVGRRSVLLQSAVQLLSLVGSAGNTAPLGSALSAVAALPPERLQKEGAASMAGAARNYAWKVKHCDSLVQARSQSFRHGGKVQGLRMTLPRPVHKTDLNIASNTAERARCQATPPQPHARGSTANMAAA